MLSQQGAGSVSWAEGSMFPEQSELVINVDEYLAVSCVYRFMGFTSYADTVAKRKLEMNRFYAADYKQVFKDFTQWLGIHSPTVDVKNRSHQRCDVEISGNVDNLLTLLSALAGSDAEYEFRKRHGEFSAKFGMKRAKDELARGSLIRIKYEGKVIQHNAQHYDQKSQTMTWDEGEVGSAGIFFVLGGCRP